MSTGSTLSGFVVPYGTTANIDNYKVAAWPTAILGKGPTGLPTPIAVLADGSIITAGGGSGGTFVLGGVQEVDTYTKVTDQSPTTIPAGSIGISFLPLTGFIGTVNGQAWLDATSAVSPGGPIVKVPQPGDTVQAYTITCSAGSYLIAVVTKP